MFDVKLTMYQSEGGNTFSQVPAPEMGENSFGLRTEQGSLVGQPGTIIGLLTGPLCMAPLEGLRLAKRNAETDPLGVTHHVLNMGQPNIWVIPEIFAMQGEEEAMKLHAVTEPIHEVGEVNVEVPDTIEGLIED